MKRLGEVIVGAGIESGNFIGYFSTCGQNQYLSLAVGFPKFPEHGHAIDTGKVEVEYHEVKDFDAQQIERLLSVVTAVDAVRQVSQAARDCIAQCSLVFDDQNTHNSLLAHSKSRLTRIL